MEKINAKFKTPYFTAAFFSFVAGLFIHLFGLVNILHNHDSIYRIPTGYGTGVRSGRWFLTILGELVEQIFGGYNLAWLNGIIFIALIAISVGFIVRIFEISSYKSAVLIGICMVAFPSVASTLFYRFTTIYYGISIFLSIFAVYAVKRFKYGYMLSILCIALSMGIYQAYVCFAIALFVLLLIKLSLQDDTSIKKIAITGLFYCVILILGVLLYFLLMKCSLIVYNTTLVDYKGINNMGIFSIQRITGLIKYAIKSVVYLPLQDYEDIAQTKLIGFSYAVIGLISLAELIIVFVTKKVKPLHILSCFVFCALLPLAANFVVVMCGIDDVYTLMVFPLVTLLFLPLILESIIPATNGKHTRITKYLGRATVAVLGIIICLYAYQANANYTIQYYNNEQIKNYYNRMITQVQMTEGYDTEKKWVFIGEINDPLLTKSWSKVNHYGGNMALKTLLNFRRTSWIENYLGISVPIAKESDINILIETPEVLEMPCWPNEGSIKIIDNFVIIKLSEPTQ